MKKLSLLFLTLILAFALAGCGGQKAAPAGGNNQSKTLIVYFSRSGNTKEVASQIQQLTGGDIVELQITESYPSNYEELRQQVKREQQSGFRPTLKTKIANISAYKTVIIGSPIWWSDISLPMVSFLTQYDLSGKTVLPFFTHGGGGVGRSAARVKELCPRSTVKELFIVKSSDAKTAKNDVASWLRAQGAIK